MVPSVLVLPGLSEAPVAPAVRAPARAVPGARTAVRPAWALARSYKAPAVASEKERKKMVSALE